MSDKRLAGLNNAAQKKKQEALKKTEKAIALLTKNQQKITIRSVAREAGVSVSYIYKYPELVYRIHRLKEQQQYSLIASNQGSKNDKQQVEILKQEKAQLELEITELKAIIERVKTSKNTLKDLKTENIQLATENIRLKKELEYTTKSLQSAREFILEQGRIELNQAETKLKIKEVQKILEK